MVSREKILELDAISKAAYLHLYFRTKEYLSKVDGVTLQPGEVLVNMTKLAEQNQTTKRTIITRLERLQEIGAIQKNGRFKERQKTNDPFDLKALKQANQVIYLVNEII